MKISYTVSADHSIGGTGWVCYYRDIFSLSAVFDELLKVIKSDTEVTFDELREDLNDAYYAKTAQSKADLYFQSDILEICKPGKTMPHIWITRNKL